MKEHAIHLIACEVPKFRMHFDDVIIQATADGLFDGEWFEGGFYEVIARGDHTLNGIIMNNDNTIDGHIDHKRQVVRVLRGYTVEAVEKLSETKLDGILRDSASYHLWHWQEKNRAIGGS